MRQRLLGATGLRVSEIGFGTWGIGGDRGGAVAYGPTDDRESLRALARAFELGVTFYDTADLYGRGHSEELLAQAFGQCRDRVIIASKGGFRAEGDQQDFSIAHLRAALEGSLRRLGTDYVDLYQLHSAPLERLRAEPEVIAFLEDLRRQGKIRAYGLSLRRVEDGQAAIEELGFAAIQVNFNLADQRLTQTGLLDLCAARNVGVIGRTPLSFGFLSGTTAPDAAFGALDHRRRWSVEQRTRWAAAADHFGAGLETEAQTPAQMALRFCLSYPAITPVIPGLMNVREVEEDAAASGLGPFGDAQLVELERRYRESEFFVSQAR